VKERTVEIGIRRALGATRREIERQFFFEGFFLTFASGAAGMSLAVALCVLVNHLPLPARFSGMLITWQTGVFAFAVLVAVGVLTSSYPARRAARLAPIEALRYER
jgi:putative ABC transport system permease protein